MGLWHVFDDLTTGERLKTDKREHIFLPCWFQVRLVTFLFWIWPQQLLPLLPEWLLLIRPQELPWWPPLTSGVLVHYWELPSYYIYTPDHTNPFNSTSFTLSFTILTHLFGRVLKCPACECLGVQITRENQRGIPIPNLGILCLLLRVTLILHLHTRSHHSLQLNYILHYHLESCLNYSEVCWSCHSCGVFRGSIHQSE